MVMMHKIDNLYVYKNALCSYNMYASNVALFAYYILYASNDASCLYNLYASYVLCI